MTLEELGKLSIGNIVYWEDPDHGHASCAFRILAINTDSEMITDYLDSLAIGNEDGTVNEVLAAELMPPPS